MTRFAYLFLTLALLLTPQMSQAQLMRYKASVPEEIIDFNVEDAQGKVHRISDFKGRIVVLNFWATWCPPCVKEMPSLNNLAQAFPGNDLVVLAVCKDPRNKESALKLFSHYDQKQFPLFFESATPDNGSSLNIKGLPTTMVLDRKGYLVGTLTGGTEWDHHEVLEMMQAYVEGRTPQPTSWWHKLKKTLFGS